MESEVYAPRALAFTPVDAAMKRCLTVLFALLGSLAFLPYFDTVALAQPTCRNGASAGPVLGGESQYVHDTSQNLAGPDQTGAVDVSLGRHVLRGLAGYPAIHKATRGGAKLLGAPRMMNHHLFPQQFRKFFDKAGVKIDDFTVRLSETTHLKGVHGKGVGDLPGGWNSRWQQFMEANPNATAKDIFQFGGRLMDEFGLSGLPIVPYPR